MLDGSELSYIPCPPRPSLDASTPILPPTKGPPELMSEEAAQPEMSAVGDQHQMVVEGKLKVVQSDTSAVGDQSDTRSRELNAGDDHTRELNALRVEFAEQSARLLALVSQRMSSFGSAYTAKIDVPPLLKVTSPNGPPSCAGVYVLQQDIMPNGYPVWKQLDGAHWLYSMSSGKWGIGGEAERDMSFLCDSAHIFCGQPHLGTMPDRIRPPWKRNNPAWTADSLIWIQEVGCAGASGEDLPSPHAVENKDQSQTMAPFGSNEWWAPCRPESQDQPQTMVPFGSDEWWTPCGPESQEPEEVRERLSLDRLSALSFANAMERRPLDRVGVQSNLRDGDPSTIVSPDPRCDRGSLSDMRPAMAVSPPGNMCPTMRAAARAKEIGQPSDQKSFSAPTFSAVALPSEEAANSNFSAKDARETESSDSFHETPKQGAILQKVSIEVDTSVTVDGLSRSSTVFRHGDAGWADRMSLFARSRASTRTLSSEGSERDFGAARRRCMFVNEESIKQQVMTNILEEPYCTEDMYWDSGLLQWIARSQLFDALTLVLICVNALWIGFDVDRNPADVLPDAPALFQAVESCFCAYFTIEISIRFLAFRSKQDAFLDIQFVFDWLLVCLMIFETWVVYAIVFFATSPTSNPLAGAGAFPLLRMLRLTRICRLVRILRAIPELMVLIKGIAAACPSVAWTLGFLVITMYVFAVAFRTLSKGNSLGESYFASVPSGMVTLLLPGMLPDSEAITQIMAKEHIGFAVLFMAFIVVASITIMNMLVGVLVEVVSVVAVMEKEELNAQYVRAELKYVFETMLDTDASGTLSKDEVKELLLNEKAARVISRVGVDVRGLVEIAEFHLFGDTRDTITFSDFLQLVLQLRGSQDVCVRDIVNLRKFIFVELGKAEKRILEARLAQDQKQEEDQKRILEAIFVRHTSQQQGEDQKPSRSPSGTGLLV